MKPRFDSINSDIQKEHWTKIIELMPERAIKVMGWWTSLRHALNDSRR